MKQIRTITKRRDDVSLFDAEVNSALANGWKLVNRFLAPVQAHSEMAMVYHPIWVAFLEKDVPDDSV